MLQRYNFFRNRNHYRAQRHKHRTAQPLGMRHKAQCRNKKVSSDASTKEFGQHGTTLFGSGWLWLSADHLATLWQTADWTAAESRL